MSDDVERVAREQGSPCENCGNPVEVGQVVLPWGDVGEMHADCEHPFSLRYVPGEGDPAPVVLLGEPMQHVPLAALTASRSYSDEIEGLRNALSALEAAATTVARHGAQAGPQWPKLSTALILARAALSKVQRNGQ